ncbi:IS66 family insertion sequence element accessory protein TnpA, partial [Desulfobacter vibrioformis]|uniref:IS66 family insertion sequence element accessory protein TnpA n=3 Tax=Desulfobacter vibrioformis TaxID=34031 RepID=UPI0005534CC2
MKKNITPINGQESPAILCEFYQEHLNNWKNSGLSQAEYCRQNDLTRHRFGYWKRKLFKKEEKMNFALLPINISEPSAS